jgi:NADH:ubiquinone reductase (H+-translocating)
MAELMPRRAHRVLILGGGFAGVSTAQELERLLKDRDDVEIWIVSRDNFFLFTPFLPEVCSGVLEARHAVNPLRGMVRKESTWCITADVEQVDLEAQVVTVLGGDGELHRLQYDTLVLALGGETSTFGIPGLDEHAAGMKTLADAFALRNRMIEMLERADLEEDPKERQRQLTFLVGGAGFSGVETAGEIEDFLRRVRERFYPRIGDDELHLYLVEMQDSVLPEMGGPMGRFAKRQLRGRGYEILLGTPIREVTPECVTVGDGRQIRAGTVIWTGGVRPAPLVASSGVEVDEAGRAVTAPTMETSHPGVFALGDCAAVPNLDDPQRRPHPATAQHALRQASRLARNIVARVDGRRMAPFRYRSLGTLASIGRATGVGTIFGVRVRGFVAWAMWRGYYWWRMPGINRKVRVALEWALTGLFGADPVQLKVEDPDSALSPSGRRRVRVRTIDPRS